MKYVFRIIKIFAIMSCGAFIAMMIEYGIDLTLLAGLGIATILAVLATYTEKKEIERK